MAREVPERVLSNVMNGIRKAARAQMKEDMDIIRKINEWDRQHGRNPPPALSMFVVDKEQYRWR